MITATYVLKGVTIGRRSGVNVESRLTSGGQASNWPPYNIERLSDDDYRITMALAGFSPDEIELVQKENTLFVAVRPDARSAS